MAEGNGENGANGKQQGGNGGDNGGPKTPGLPSVSSNEGRQSGSEEEKRRWTFMPGSQPDRPTGISAGPHRPTGHEVGFLSPCGWDVGPTVQAPVARRQEATSFAEDLDTS